MRFYSYLTEVIGQLECFLLLHLTPVWAFPAKDFKRQHILLASPLEKVQTGLETKGRNPWMSRHLVGRPLNKAPFWVVKLGRS